jgi:hypothetical protein
VGLDGRGSGACPLWTTYRGLRADCRSAMHSTRSTSVRSSIPSVHVHQRYIHRHGSKGHCAERVIAHKAPELTHKRSVQGHRDRRCPHDSGTQTKLPCILYVYAVVQELLRDWDAYASQLQTLTSTTTRTDQADGMSCESALSYFTLLKVWSE